MYKKKINKSIKRYIQMYNNVYNIDSRISTRKRTNIMKYKNTNFWMIPRQIYQMNIPAQAVLLYGIIYTLSVGSGNEQAFATIKQYSDFLNVTIAYVYRLLDKLEKEKIIKIEKEDNKLFITPLINNRIQILTKKEQIEQEANAWNNLSKEQQAEQMREAGWDVL